MIARRKGGASKERINTAPEFENVRKHNSEFGACAKAGAFLRHALRAYWFEKKVHERTGHVLKLMSDVMKFDAQSTYGQRRSGIGLASVEGRAYINERVLEGKLVWSAIFPKEPLMTRLSTGLRVHIDVSKQLLKYPKGATHLNVRVVYLTFDLDERSGLALQERETMVAVEDPFVLSELFSSMALPIVNELIVLRCEFFRADALGRMLAVNDTRWRYLGVFST
jgi:hypothetical protein